MIKKILSYFTAFWIGGFLYALIEILFRGRTHFAMVIVGGICFLGIFAIQRFMPTVPFLFRSLICAVWITEIEFLSGCFLNLALDLKIWDYSHLPFHVLGQVCLLFSFFWFLLSIPALWLAKKMGQFKFWRET